MIELQSTAETLDRVPLGAILEFRLVRSDPSIETRVFLRHQPLVYTRPLCDWAAEEGFLVFPESPGKYRLTVEWRSPERAGGREELDFTVVASRPLARAPVEFDLDGETRIWVPNEWEVNVFKESEKAMLAMLESVIEPGAVVYDLGANLGVYSCPMVRLAGPRGYLYCVEPNPICVQFLTTNLASLDVDNVEILPVAVLDRNGETRFTVNFGNSNLGLSEHSGFYGTKLGQEIRVPCFELDHLIDAFRLRPPDVIKLDVEGTEHLAVQGMRKTLADRRPTLVMELHGEICARATLELLDPLAYRYVDPAGGGELESTDAVCDRIGDSIFQLLARPPAEAG